MINAKAKRVFKGKKKLRKRKENWTLKLKLIFILTLIIIKKREFCLLSTISNNQYIIKRSSKTDKTVFCSKEYQPGQGLVLSSKLS